MPLAHLALPFYSLAYALSLSMVFIARADMTALTVALALAAVLYLASGWLFRRAWWLYPGLLAVHLSMLAFFAIDPAGARTHLLSVAYLPLTFFLGLVGAQLWRKRSAKEPLALRSLVQEWAVPLLIFALLDIVVWQVVSLLRFETGILVSGSHAVLIGIGAFMWASQPLAWGSLGFLALAVGLRLAWSGQPMPVIAATVAGIGLGLYLLGRLVEVLAGRPQAPGRKVLAHWCDPLLRSGMVVNTLGALAALVFVISHLGEAALALAFSGALYLGVAYKGRYYRLGYAAVAVLELALVLLLLNWQVSQPQWFAVPAGLYFIGVGVFERRRGRDRFSLLLESLGLAVLLVTSFIQSLDPENGFWYFLLLLVEGLAAMGWAAFQRRKAPFLIGLGANVFNILGQVVLVFIGGTGITRWVISILVALVLLLATMFAERWIIPRAQDLRERLEAWE